MFRCVPYVHYKAILFEGLDVGIKVVFCYARKRIFLGCDVIRLHYILENTHVFQDVTEG